MDLEIGRFFTVVLATIAVVQLVLFYRKSKEPAVIAPISWLLLIIGFDIFKYIVRDDPAYYVMSVVWTNIIFIQGIMMIIAGGYIFKDVKSWTFRR